jgi:hypothetical protein
VIEDVVSLSGVLGVTVEVVELLWYGLGLFTPSPAPVIEEVGAFSGVTVFLEVEVASKLSLTTLSAKLPRPAPPERVLVVALGVTSFGPEGVCTIVVALGVTSFGPEGVCTVVVALGVTSFGPEGVCTVVVALGVTSFGPEGVCTVVVALGVTSFGPEGVCTVVVALGVALGLRVALGLGVVVALGLG